MLHILEENSNPANQPEPLHLDAGAPLQLRPYQEEACLKIAQSLSKNRKAGIIMPTGSGKTVCFIKVAQLYLTHNPSKAVLILSHLSILTNQTFERFRQFAPEIEVGIFQADKTPSRSARVIIGTMQTSRSADKVDSLQELLSYPIGLIIVDEAHFLQTASYDKAISFFPQAKVLGCTATPFRSGAIMTNYFDEIAYSISMKELIEDGYLVPPKLLTFELKEEEKSVSDRIALIGRLYEEKEAGKHAIIFMNSIEAAKEMRNVINSRGFSARAITSELVGEHREAILEDFRSGKIQVLTTVNVLTAGFDSPNVEAIFMPFATESPVTYLQRVGRGLRPCEQNGKKDCRIYVCGDAPSVKRKLYEKLHDSVLDAGSKKKQKGTTFQEDFQYNDLEKSSETYVWTETVIKTIAKMEEIGMERLANLLNEKKFPKRFLDDIASLRANLPQDMPRLQDGTLAMTQSQKTTLSKLGFKEDVLAGITKNEASAMIATCLGQQDKWRSMPFIIPSGKFRGQHIKNTSFYYRQAILSANPNGEISQIIRGWEKQGGGYEKSPRAKR